MSFPIIPDSKLQHISPLGPARTGSAATRDRFPIKQNPKWRRRSWHEKIKCPSLGSKCAFRCAEIDFNVSAFTGKSNRGSSKNPMTVSRAETVVLVESGSCFTVRIRVDDKRWLQSLFANVVHLRSQRKNGAATHKQRNCVQWRFG